MGMNLMVPGSPPALAPFKGIPVFLIRIQYLAPHIIRRRLFRFS